MKWAFQIACVLLIILIGVGPASAAVGCVLGNSAMGPSCPMGLTIPTAVEGNSQPEVSQNFTANSPPRYILLRVFRI
jgi:hypothetical protein